MNSRRRFEPVIVFGVPGLAGCGGSDSDSGEPTAAEPNATEPTAAEPAVSGDPLECLDAAGLSSVEERGSDVWRGFHDGPFYGVAVQRLPSQAEARDLVADAVDVYAAQTGEFVVTGPAKPSAGGLVTADEALEADRIVSEVASCLGG